MSDHFLSGSAAPQAEPQAEGLGSAEPQAEGLGSAAPQADGLGSEVPHAPDCALNSATFLSISLMMKSLLLCIPGCFLSRCIQYSMNGKACKVRTFLWGSYKKVSNEQRTALENGLDLIIFV